MKRTASTTSRIAWIDERAALHRNGSQAQAVPMHCGVEIAVVGHADDDLRLLVEMKRRECNRICQHPQFDIVEPLTYWNNVDVEAISVSEPNGARAPARAD